MTGSHASLVLFTWVGAGLVGLSFILTEYLDREVIRKLLKERPTYPWFLYWSREVALFGGWSILVAVVFTLFAFGGGK